MPAGAFVDDRTERKEGKAMIRRGIGLGGRLAAVGFATALVLSLAGDFGRAATVPAVINGQDPLEVLSLKIRPNVIVVLDSSGSMTSKVSSGQTSSGDHPLSRMYQAKQVLRQTIQNNQDKVSFMLGTYTQFSVNLRYQDIGRNRFQYSTTDVLFPNMATTELRVEDPPNESADRGLQSWQIIYQEWNTLYFQEDSGTICTAVLTGPFPKFYQTGDDLAADLESAMDASPCANNYRVTYDEGSGDFAFSRQSGSRQWRIRWADGPNNIRNALAETTASTTSYCDTCTRYTDAPWTLLYRTPSGTANNLAWPFNGGIDTDFTFTETSGGSTFTSYQLASSRIWNGETVRVESDGTICGVTFPTAADKTNPPSITLQLVNSGCGSDVAGESAVFTWAGGSFSASQVCRGFRSKVDLIPCDLQSPPAPLQIETALPYLDNELPFDSNGDPADWSGDGNPDYVEEMDGGWGVASVNVAPSAKASGSTPLGNTLIDIKGEATGTGCITNAPPIPGGLDLSSQTGTTGACVERNFSKLWNTGQTGATAMAGPAPYALDAIKNHLDPKEKTIVLLVTDGNDTCDTRTNALGETDLNALRAAHKAEELYQRLDALEPASSVQTYVVGFGGAFTGGEPTRLNWIAWGGSGLGQNQTGQPDVPTTDSGDARRWNPPGCNISYSNVNNSTCVNNYLKGLRARCTTCQDAFVAPDAATLAAQLQGIIDQGASEGEFSAQQSITESIFEYVDLASNMTDTFDPRDPRTRYLAIVPTRIISSFTLPGFEGQVKAYQNDGFGNAVLKWSAGDVLQQLVQRGMVAACPANGTTGASLGECSFGQLHGSASEATIATSSAAIKRRVYTTERNGVYTFDAPSLEAYGRGAWTPPERVVLWPPDTQVAPTNLGEGILDAALGLPLDSSTDPAGDLLTLQNEFGACVGNNMPGGCTGGSTTNQMKTARLEAREMILAFMAGAQPAVDGNGPKRSAANNSGVSAGDIFYTARGWILGDSELATAAVVTQPLPSEPLATPWVSEYQLFRDGDGTSRPDTDEMLMQGYGLRSPDGDASGTGNDSRANLKPVMTVVYSPANDMLHAFRAGPNVSPSTSCDDDPVTGTPGHECGGQELWGFVPFDQLGTLRLRYINEPQGRDNHVYMLARGVRFADVFVADATPPMSVTINGQNHDVNGVWRRILYFGRGIGGKYFTALDVTGPGAYTRSALGTAGPVPLWSRGNPDSQDGTAGGPDNGTDPNDRLDYAEMGETWSLPTIAYRDKTANTNALYGDVDYVLYMGSGYGGPGEGSTFFTLDALTGDVLATADVEAAAAALGIDRPTLTYPNALVANAVGFNPAVFSLLQTVHPAASAPTRVYIGDIHGRLWKFLTARPEVALPVADLGEDQPVGTAVSLLGIPPSPDTPVPYIFAVSGNERRADGPFKMFGFIDEGTDDDISIPGTDTSGAPVTTYLPSRWLHTREYDQGLPEANCGYTEEAVFRGTIQPATAFECSNITTGTCQDPVGRVFFGGTRLNLPNTVFAPPTPLACGIGSYPCRSSFDSIIYALGAKTGLAAYDLNASGDDAYRIYRDNRIAAISMLADPDPTRGGSSFNPDEGKMKTPPKPPPPPGVPPTSTSATANVLMVRLPGQPPPSVHYGSTVCQ
jgi:hypothetical protein